MSTFTPAYVAGVQRLFVSHIVVLFAYSTARGSRNRIFPFELVVLVGDDVRRDASEPTSTIQSTCDHVPALSSGRNKRWNVISSADPQPDLSSLVHKCIQTSKQAQYKFSG